MILPMRFFIFVIYLFALPAVAQNYPDYASTYVNDFAGLLNSDTKRRVTGMLRNVKEERGVEMTVVTVESRNDYGDFDAIEPFATGLFNFWGIGDAKRNDGILILVARRDRDMRIELGAGYPPVFDDRVKRVIDHHFIPYFREDNYAAGIEAGVAETIKRTRLEFDENGVTRGSRLRLEGQNILDSATSGGIFTWILAAFAGIIGLGGVISSRGVLRNRPRRCHVCGQKMRRLSESADDAHLNQGQKIEESVKSKDYDVWVCAKDGSVIIEAYNRWFSGFGACPSCSYRTLHSRRTTLISATKSSSGRARVDYDCRYCQHHYSEEVTIPRVSSSSSSSGSSFSGGSSSGGGASGSW